jgi:hypothetical protein
MKGRWWVLVACATTALILVLLASSLDSLAFEPGRPFAIDGDTWRPVFVPDLRVSEDEPLWKVIAFWLALVVNTVIVLLLLSPELRRRALRQLLRVGMGLLSFLLLVHYGILQLPQFRPFLPSEASATGGSTPESVEVAVFRQPALSPWFAFALALIVIWLLFLAGYLIYRLWTRQRDRQTVGSGAIAKIARSSLAELAAGHEWGDVVIEAYARMQEAVRIGRGLRRDSSSTPREFAARLSGARLPASAVDELTRLFEVARYGGRPTDGSARRRAAACLESILEACEVPA